MPEILLKARSRSSDALTFQSQFSELPEKVREGKARMGMIPSALWVRFLEMAPAPYAEFWVAEIEGEAVGRIGANCMRAYPETGAVGFFDVDTRRPDANAIASALIDSALEWMSAQGLSKAVGPLNLNTWFSYRFRTDSDPLAFPWEPNQPEAYPGYFLQKGFVPVETFVSTGVDGLDDFVGMTEKDWLNAKTRGYSFRGFNPETLMEVEVPLLYTLSEGFKDNYYYESIPFDAFRQLYVPIAKKMDFSYCCFAVDPKGKEVGFFFGFLEGESFVIKSITVLPEGRGLGLSNAMIYEVARHAVAKGFHQYTVALVKQGNRSESYAKKGKQLWLHEYVLLEKSLSTA